MLKRFVLVFVAALLVASSAVAEVKLPALVSDHMVLQRDMSLSVWGWADPGAKVTVTIAQQRKTAVADATGRWELKLDALPAGGPLELTVSDGASSVQVKDVLVGDVWLCSGQSNMAMSVRGVNNADQEIAAANLPQVRHFKTGPQPRADAPQTQCSGEWAVCSPETVGSFTATGFFFGRYLHKALNVPIGLINSSWGGTCIEAWMPHDALASVEPGRAAIEAFEQAKASFDRDKADAQFEQAMKRYEEAIEKRKVATKVDRAKVRVPRKPRPAPDPNRNQNSPSALYNGMIQPLVPYAIRGAIWYQGERNSRTIESAVAYRELMPTLIRSWRKVWGEGDFPFFFVQLPNFNNENWPAIRESFLKTLQTPRTGMAITIDVGDATNIHPKNKQAVGKRLALAALHVAYGQDLAYSGPLYRSMEKDGNKIRLHFDCVFDGLVAKGGGKLQGFSVAGSDKEFVPADAVIDGETVVVSSPEIDKPVAVRYAWAANPDCNLFNQAGLPASPFRTDQWPLE